MRHGAAIHEMGSEDLMQLLDGELTAERASEVAAHVSGCAECREMMAKLQESSAQLAAWKVGEVGQASQALERLRRRANEAARRRRGANLLGPRSAAVACGLLLALTFWAQRLPSRIQVDEQTVRAKLIKTASSNPKYPEEARRKKIQGEVILHIVVARDGSVKKLKVVSGDPILAKAAAEGVKRWKFEPTTVDGKTVEVESDVQIGFRLDP